MTPARQALLFAGLCMALYLPGLGAIPLYTRGEAREALAVREVVRTDRWLVPMRPDGELTRKPPLFYWTGAAALGLLPLAPEWAIRLPSVAAGTLGVISVALLGNTALGATAGVSALMLAVSFEWFRSSTAARVDMLLCLGMTLILVASIRALAAGGTRWTGAVAATGVLIAALAKGPIGVGFPAVAVGIAALVSRDPSFLRLLPPLVAGAALAGCWYAAAWLAHGQAFLDVVLRENLGRFVDPNASGTGHEHGPFYLLLVGFGALLPWTPLLPFVATRAAMPRSVRVLLAAWIATVASVVMLSASKREVYLLPIFPALTMLIADGLLGETSPRLARIVRASTWPYAPVLTLIAVLIGVVAAGMDLPPWIVARLKPEDTVAARAIVDIVRSYRWIFLLAAAATTVLAVAIARARATEQWRRLVVLVAGALAAWGTIFQLTAHPAIGRVRGVGDFMQAIDPLVPPRAPLFAFFPVDPSLRFYAPRPVERWQSRPDDGDAFLLVWERELGGIPALTAPPIERVAASGRRHGRRGQLILLRVPPGTVPKKPATAAQKG